LTPQAQPQLWRDPSERIREPFVFFDHAAWHEPFAFGWLVCSEPDKHVLIWIANYHVDRNERRIANDLSKLVLIEQLRAHLFTHNEEKCPGSSPGTSHFPQQLGQFGDIAGDPSCLSLAEQLRRRPSPRLILEIGIGELLPVVIQLYARRSYRKMHLLTRLTGAWQATNG
jgi:hypothetical protein